VSDAVLPPTTAPVELSIDGITDAVLVGRGGYGSVYRARQVRFHREVAVKVLAGELDEAAAVRFERECAAMGSLSGHPHIVTVFDSGIAAGQPYIIMEYLPGGSLHDLLVQGRVPWVDVLDYGVKLAGALESSHREGVLHRDVKPENILLSAWGEPHLGDFGIARVKGAYETAAGKVTATLVHAAPELLGGQSPGPASDLYALASTLYELLAGAPPFWLPDEDTIAPLLRRIALDAPPDLRARGVPAAVADVIELGLTKDPTDRPESVAAFGRRLQETQQACGQAISKMLVARAIEPPVTHASPGALAPPSPRTMPPPPPRPRAPRPGGPPAPPSLLDQVTVLLESAIGFYGPATDGSTLSGDRLRRVRDRLGEPLRVAIVGRVKAGKSTLLNALVGEELAPTDAGECTRVVTWYVDGPSYKATLHPRNGDPRAAAFAREGGAISISLGELTAEALERIVIEWPSSALRSMSLIDTPGLASISAELSASTEAAFSGEVSDSPADAIVYLTRHLHPSDLRFLDAFTDRDDSAPTSVIAVLSRADEVGVGRADAMDSAARVAARYARDPRLRRICQAVVPVAGLIAQAGVTLREDEFHAFGVLARLAPDELEGLLLSVDDFVDTDPSATSVSGLTSVEREDLLDRFGLFGIRRSVDLVRTGAAPTSSRLADELVALSGLANLRRLLMQQFAGRRDVLKARAALAVIDDVLRTDHRDGSDALGAELERITAGAHDLVELRVLDLVRSGAIPVREEERDAVERLLGAEGARPASRLGLPPDSSPAEVRAALLDTAARWQRRAENPLTQPKVADAARVLIRTCEGVLLLMDESA